MKIKIFDIIFLIFLLIFIFRLFFALQTPYFSDDYSYYANRQISNIIDTGRHITYDEFSYGGREVLGMPIWFYILAFFKSLFGDYALKIMPAFFISLLIFIVYLIAKKITEDETSAYLAAICSGFIPIFVVKTLNSSTIYALIYPMLFLLIYSFYRIENKGYIVLFIILTFLLSLMHPISFLLAISFLIYNILAYVENAEIEGIKKEGLLLLVIVTFLFNFIIYKKAFAVIGLNTIWQNIPSSILSGFFKEINIFDIMLNAGIVPLVFGIIGIYFAIKNKNKDVFVLISICITSIVLLLAKLLDFATGLVIVGITLAIISAIGFEKLFKYISITKLASHIKTIKVSLIVLIFLTLIVPSIINANNLINGTISETEIEPFLWMGNKTALSATILSDIEEGNLITGIAKRKDVIDTNFMYVDNIDKRFEETTSLFILESEVKALGLIKKYDIDYIYLSEKAKKKYKIEALKYSIDENCFEKVFENDAGEIIKVIC